MTTVIERVAKAIENLCDGSKGTIPPWRVVAKAAIEAYGAETVAQEPVASIINRIKNFALAAYPGEEGKYLTQIMRICTDFENSFAMESGRIATADQASSAPLGSEVRENRAYIATRQPAAVAVPEVAVKALEWKPVALVPGYNWLTIAQAETPFGRYTLDKHDKGFLRVLFNNQRVGHFEAGEELVAKAAAQADYEQRIRSALTAAHSPASESVYAKSISTIAESLKRHIDRAEEQFGECSYLNWIKRDLSDIRAIASSTASKPAPKVVEKLRDELNAAASLFEALSEDFPEDDVSAIMMRVMAARIRAALSSQEESE